VVSDVALLMIEAPLVAVGIVELVVLLLGKVI
jgi:hypothetical protein